MFALQTRSGGLPAPKREVSIRRGQAPAPQWLLLASLTVLACSKPPPECSNESLAHAANADALSNKLYARNSVVKALDAAAAAREALDKKDYARAAPLCKTALELSLAAEAAIDAAKKRQGEGAPLAAEVKKASDDVELALQAARSLLDVVPQAELDEKLRGLGAKIKTLESQANAAKALVEGSGWNEDLAPLKSFRDQLIASKSEADAVILEVRRGATAKCKPREKKPLFLGVRARSHNGFALVEAGESEEAPTGFVAVVHINDAGACRFIAAKPDTDFPSPTDKTVDLSMWRIGGTIPVNLLVAWNGRHAWFFSESGRWQFDSAKVAGFADSCEQVACTTPKPNGDHADVNCTCTPKPGVENLELARDVRFSWHGSSVSAER